GHRLNWAILVKPFACRLVDDLAVGVALGSAALGQHWHGRKSCVDTPRGPDVATRDENVGGPAPVHERKEIVEVHALGIAFIVGRRGGGDGGRGEFWLLCHGAHPGLTRALKSAPGAAGMGLSTLRVARGRRLVGSLAAAGP